MSQPYLRQPVEPPRTSGHKWDFDVKSGAKKCVRCGETYWNGPMRECVRVERTKR